MNRILKGMLCISLLLSTASLFAADCCSTDCSDSCDSCETSGKSFFHGRSQGSDTARELVGWEQHINRPDMDEFYGSFKITPMFQQTFHGCDIGKYLFFNDKNKMTFGQPVATGANAIVDVNAWNFGVAGAVDGATGFKSEVTINPRVQNFILDLGLFLGLDEWVEGLYFQVNMPLTYSKWDIRLSEKVETEATEWVAATVNKANAVVATGATTIKEALKGQTLFGDMQTAWEYGKVNACGDNKFRPADIEVILGYNFINKDKGFLGLNLRFMAPTGNDVTSKYLFEPMVGDDHWKFGAGLKGKAVLWDKEEDKELSAFLDGYVVHMFETCQKRSFDFKHDVNGKGSRYLLLKEFTDDAYQEKLVNAINITTLNSDVKIDVEGEASLMLYYKDGGFSSNLGYNIWGRTKEKVCIKEDITANKYGFFGVAPAAAPSATAGEIDFTIGDAVATDIKIDGTWTEAKVVAAGAADSYIGNANLENASAAAPSAISHKVFLNIQYNWWDNDYCPFIGIGGDVEFSGDHNHAFEQWGVWLTGGFCY